jgi:hypothetical protein
MAKGRFMVKGVSGHKKSKKSGKKSHKRSRKSHKK